MLGDNIKRIRLNHNLSQAAFGEILCVSQAAVSQWEQGVTRPDTDQLIAISAAFSVSIDKLMKDDPIPSFREFSISPQEPPLNSCEIKLVRFFRFLNSIGQKRILMLIEDYIHIYGVEDIDQNQSTL